MKKKRNFLLPLLMAIVMMAMSPQSVWAGGTQPTSGDGSSSNPYVIETEANLIWYRDYVNAGNGTACAKLNNDITLSSAWTTGYTAQKQCIGWNNNNNTNYWFRGTFDGNNKTISNLNMTINWWEQGLFGITRGCTIKDLTVKGNLTSDANESSQRHSIGGVVGYIKDFGEIRNVHSEVNITMKCNNYTKVGGVVGWAYGSESSESLIEITDCSYSGTITLESNLDNVGGIAGYVDNWVAMSGCNFSGTINTYNNSNSIGGIVGCYYTASSTLLSLVNSCTNSGTMNVDTGKNIGGIAGYAEGYINFGSDTFASSARITPKTTSTQIGYVAGIVGLARGTLTVKNSQNLGSIESANSWDCIAGIVGYIPDNNAVLIENCLYAGSISSTSTDTRLHVAGILGYTNKSSFRGINHCLSCGTFSTSSSNSTKAGAIAGALYESALTKLENNYYKEGIATAAVWNTSSGYSLPSTNYQVTEKELADGPVCYLLNDNTSGGDLWRQNITSGTVDAYPVLTQTHNKVYYSYVNCEARAKSYNNRDEQTRGHKFTTSKGSGVYQCTVCSRLGGTKPTITNNVYQIATAGNLIYFSDKTNGYGLTSTDDMTRDASASASLTADIDLSSTGWTNSIGETAGYSGTFNGNNHSIKNMTSGNGTESRARALFCTINSAGKVYGLTLDGSYVFLNDAYNGSLARRNYGTIERCLVVNGYVQCGYNNYLAGFCGVNEASGVIRNCGTVNTTVHRCYSAKNNHYASAFVDVNCSGGTIENCYAKDAKFIYTNNSWFIAFNQSGATLSNCYFSWGSSVSGTKHTGCIVSSAEETMSGLANVATSQFTTGEMCYKLNGSTSSGTLAWYQKIGSETFPHFVKADGKTVYYSYAYCEARSLSYNNVTSRTTRGHNFAVKNSTQGVYQCSLCNHWGGTQPTITNGVYHIATAGNLVYFSDKTNGQGLTASDDMASVTGITAVLDNDIDMSSVGAYIPAALYSDYLPYRLVYTGTFDGQGHTISNLKVVAPDQCEGGMFGRLGGTVKNLILKNETVTGTPSASDGTRLGGLCGLTLGCTVHYVGEVGVTITDRSTQKACGGGLAGVYHTGSFAWSYTDHENFFGTGSQVSDHLLCFENVTSAQKTSGELCFKLNNNAVSGQVWHQNLSGTKDSYPIPSNTHSTVYITLNNDCDFAYTNTAYADQTLNLSVGTAAKLNNVARLYANGFVGGTVNVTLTADIDYTAYKTVYDMIGCFDAYPYKGTFNGQGHSLKVDITHGENYVAPFRSIDGATIKNLYLYGSVTNTGGGCAAGVVSHVLKNACTLENIICDVEINSSYSGGSANGGLVAHAYTADVTINNCAYRGKFNGANASDWGGFIGWIENGRTGTITNSYVALDSKSSYNSTGCATFARTGGTLAGGNNYYYSLIGVDNWTDCSQFAAGELCYKLNGGEMVNPTWRQNLGSNGDTYPVQTKTTSNIVYGLNRNYNNTGKLPVSLTTFDGKKYGAIYADFPWTLEATDVKAYIAESNDNSVLKMKEVSSVPAGTSVVLVGSTDGTASLTYNADATGSQGILKGSDEAVAASGKYLFGRKDGIVGFYTTTAEQVAAFKPYLETEGSAKGFRLVFEDGETTNLSPALSEGEGAQSVYNLNGQKLAAPRKGINIINGKKVMVK